MTGGIATPLSCFKPFEVIAGGGQWQAAQNGLVCGSKLKVVGCCGGNVWREATNKNKKNLAYNAVCTAPCPLVACTGAGSQGGYE